MQKLCFYVEFGTELDEFGTESAQFGTEFRRVVIYGVGKR